MTLALACTPAVEDSGVPWSCDQEPTGQVDLPADEGVHDQPIEWWYWTGHLWDEQGRRYGFEQTFFVFQMGFYESTSAHLGFTNLDTEEFTFEVAYLHDVVPEPMTGGFQLEAGENSAVGLDGEEHLVASAEGFAWDLDLSSQKPVVFQHGDGFHEYAVGGNTWYYSRQRIEVSGELVVDGETRPVTGQAWMDHQWGQLTQTTTAGWDWFSIQLEDDREIMLFMVKGSDQVIGGSITDSGCNTRELSEDELQVVVTSEWISPNTGCSYPAAWDITVGEESFQVQPLLADQELYNEHQTYWEGAADVTGSVSGHAYVELTGYCD